MCFASAKNNRFSNAEPKKNEIVVNNNTLKLNSRNNRLSAGVTDTKSKEQWRIIAAFLEEISKLNLRIERFFALSSECSNFTLLEDSFPCSCLVQLSFYGVFICISL